MGMPTSVSELLIMQKLADVLGHFTPDEAQAKVERWFENVIGEAVSYDKTFQLARLNANYTAPGASLKRVMDFMEKQPDFDPMQYRNLPLDLSLALSKPICCVQALVFGDLAQTYSGIEAALSPDFLLRLTYVGKGKRSAEDAQQVTVSMEELDLPAKPYVLTWDHIDNVILHAKEPASTAWPDRFSQLADVLIEEAGDDFLKLNPAVLGLIDPDGKNHALIGFNPEEGDLIIATTQGESAIAHSEYFDPIKPVFIERKSNTLFDRIVGLETRLGLTVPDVLDNQAPSFHFLFNRGNERIKIESNDDKNLDLGTFDETDQRPVSPHFYYGIVARAANSIWILNGEAANRFKTDLKNGLDHKEASQKAVDFLLSELKARHGCEQIATPIPTFDDDDSNGQSTPSPGA